MRKHLGTPVYLDYNATTPVDPEVVKAMRFYFEKYFGNPSSSHWHGTQTKKAIEYARKQVSVLLGCDPSEIVFTSGGTESNNYAIKGIAYALRGKGNHIITSQIEHPAVLEVCRHLEQSGFEITCLPVDTTGLVSVSDVEKAIKPHTILITVMHANNEVGTIQPIEEIARLARERDITIHTDAAQSVGKIDTNVNRLVVDLLSVAGHKLYAPKGIGALYIRKGLKLQKLIHGAGHEQGRRAGTENVSGIVGLGKACEMALRNLKRNSIHTKRMRDTLHQKLIERVLDIKLNGHPEKCLPNTLSLGFKDINASQLLLKLQNIISVSAGSACHGSSPEISHVLRAMSVPAEYALGTLRFSTSKMTAEAEIEKTAVAVSKAVQDLRKTKVSYKKVAV